MSFCLKKDTRGERAVCGENAKRGQPAKKALGIFLIHCSSEKQNCENQGNGKKEEQREGRRHYIWKGC